MSIGGASLFLLPRVILTMALLTMALLTMATLTTVARACGHEAFRSIDPALAGVATVAARHARLRPAGLAAADAGVAPRLAGVMNR